MDLDFYTVKTTVDIDSDRKLFDCLVSAVGFFSQPLIVGEPHIEEEAFLWRFAVRVGTLRPYEENLIENLAMANNAFTAENTELVRAARI